MDDAKAFPIYAGATLVTLYALIKYFGKEVVNPLILTYMGIGNVGGMKAALSSLTGGAVDFLDEKVIVHLKINMIGLDLEVTVLDVIGLIMSAISVLIYVYTKNWIYNNILAILFCVHAIQMIFLGNFKNGFALLTFLFFYDVFFVFGTDVMLTVAKNIDAPIKLLFPKNLTVDPPEFSLLGLGDIVIPGIFIALCLRYDVLRALDVNKVKELVNGGKADEVTKLLQKQ
jgi:minor histocompatibility antigen H13